ncbi:hypothetical protein AVEN_131798-1 [Araneus ventricosus]|uniref:Uncharacterized protein n=1 Tax=Araneus ventricosus TaxID=182803 RepID=A0A4Y2U3Q6_ARAVE|nr:hypothetical protein AVEN_131798-1 [Araneus ventricosus]
MAEQGVLRAYSIPSADALKVGVVGFDKTRNSPKKAGRVGEKCLRLPENSSRFLSKFPRRRTSKYIFQLDMPLHGGSQNSSQLAVVAISYYANTHNSSQLAVVAISYYGNTHNSPQLAVVAISYYGNTHNSPQLAVVAISYYTYISCFYKHICISEDILRFDNFSVAGHD